MLSFKQYVRAQSLEEAYTLCQKKNNVVLGGMLWLKMQNRTVGCAIDLCDLGLDTIEETESEYRIGAMVSLRALEQHAGLNALTCGALREAVKHIVGVQFRNVATIGGSLFGRFGFSDVLTLFLALDAKVELYHAGVLSISEFAELPWTTRDILVRVIVPKKERKCSYLSMRNTQKDFPVLTCAVSYVDGKYLCCVGARPMKAKLYGDENEILSEKSERAKKSGQSISVDALTEETAEKFAADIAKRAVFGSNMRGSGEYRKKLCEVLVRRALLALKEV